MATRTVPRAKNRGNAAARKSPATTPPPRRSPDAAAVPPSPEVLEETDTRAADLRDRSADILDGARWTGAQEAAQLIREAEVCVGQIRRTAAADARRLLAEVTEEAAERLRRAESDADGIRERADDDRQALLDSARAAAQRETEAALAAAGVQADELLAEAESRVGEVLAEAEQRATALVEMRRAAAEAAYGKALDDAGRVLADAQQTAGEITAARASLDAELDLTRRRELLVLDEELAGRRKEIEATLAQVRAECDQARRQLDEEFRKLGEQHHLERKGQKDRLAEELEEMRANSEAAARSRAQEIVASAEREKSDLVHEVNASLARARQHEADAEQYLEKARASARRTSKVKGVTGRLWRAAPWVALAAGVGLAASGEFQLAKLVGFHEYVAPLFPLSVDVYAIVAFKKKRDVRPALSIMAASNLAYHLAERGGVHDPANPYGGTIVLGLTALVVITFVVIIWRVHVLLEGDHDEPVADPVDTGTASSAAGGSPEVPATGSPTGTATGKPPSTGTGNPGGTGTGSPTGNRPPTGTGNPGGTGTGTPPGKGGGKPGAKGGGKPGGKRPGNTPTPEQRQAVRDRATAILDAGDVPSPTALAAEFGGLDPEWVRNQIRAVRA
ncbi:hypothetical protein ACFU6M_30030 [Streptomyces bottropensis]|uniref:hypothetical protein n=1 Tax=Streptomyces bottropensis TaxID=42235 RepID=UPI0036A7A4AF